MDRFADLIEDDYIFIFEKDYNKQVKQKLARVIEIRQAEDMKVLFLCVLQPDDYSVKVADKTFAANQDDIKVIKVDESIVKTYLESTDFPKVLEKAVDNAKHSLDNAQRHLQSYKDASG